MPLRKKLFTVISLSYLLYLLVPLVQTFTGVELWLINLCTFLALIALYPLAFNTKLTLWFCMYALVLAFFVLMGKPLTVGIGTVEDSRKIFIEYAFLLPNLAIFNILYYLRDQRLYRIIGVSSLLLLAFSFLYMLPLLAVNNVLMRDAHVLAMEQNITTLGIPSYTLMHAYIIILPAFLLGLKNLKVPLKWVLLASFILYLYIILHTYITTSLIIALSIILISLFYNPTNRFRSVITIVLVFFILFILHIFGIFIVIFDLLLQLFADTDVEPKIQSFKYLYEFGEEESSGGQLSGRMDLHSVSWQVFSENILIGDPSFTRINSQLG